MRKNKAKTRNVVVTRKEALSLLGIRKGALISLEQAAKVRAVSERGGYTAKELKSLMAKLKNILMR